MIIKMIDKYTFNINLYRECINNINIYDEKEVSTLIKSIIKKIISKIDSNGILYFDIYTDSFYGMIIDVTLKDIPNKNNIDIKLSFHLNSVFLYEIDYFYHLKLPINSYNLYYFNNKYYLELVKNIGNKKYLKLLENSVIIVNNTEILNNCIKLH